MKGNSVHESAHSHNENAEHSIMTSSKYLNLSLPNYIYLLIRKTLQLIVTYIQDKSDSENMKLIYSFTAS